MVKIQALSLFIKKLCSNSTIQLNRVRFTAPNVVYGEIVSRGFFVFLLWKPWPLYRTDMSLMHIAVVPMYLHFRDIQIPYVVGWGRGWKGKEGKGTRCLITFPAAAAATGVTGTAGNGHLRQSRRLRPRGWGCVHGPSITWFLFAWTEICTLLSQAWIKTCSCQGFLFFSPSPWDIGRGNYNVNIG